MIYSHTFDGVTAKTGDILFTRDGEPGSVFGAIWKVLGYVLPGDLDHTALYVGPGIRFIESAARGVVVVTMEGESWQGRQYGKERLLVDHLVCISDTSASSGND